MINKLSKSFTTILRGRKDNPTQALILMYHRVSDDDQDRFNINVTAANFAAQMEYIQTEYTPISLDKLIFGLEQDNLPEKSIVVTFDDGYSSVFQRALPILEQNGVHATVYITANYIGSSEGFWWDRYERISESYKKIDPEQLQNAAQKVIGSNISNIDTPNMLFRAMHKHLRSLNWSDRDRKLDLLQTLLSVDESDILSPHLVLNKAELILLSQNPLISIGSHTLSHPYLPALVEEDQFDEISKSRVYLSEMVEKPIRHFSYPFGGSDSRTKELVKSAGYHSATITESGVVKSTDSMYELKRVNVPDLGITKFAHLLEENFNGSV